MSLLFNKLISGNKSSGSSAAAQDAQKQGDTSNIRDLKFKQRLQKIWAEYGHLRSDKEKYDSLNEIIVLFNKCFTTCAGETFATIFGDGHQFAGIVAKRFVGDFQRLTGKQLPVSSRSTVDCVAEMFLNAKAKVSGNEMLTCIETLCPKSSATTVFVENALPSTLLKMLDMILQYRPSEGSSAEMPALELADHGPILLSASDRIFNILFSLSQTAPPISEMRKAEAILVPFKFLMDHTSNFLTTFPAVERCAALLNAMVSHGADTAFIEFIHKKKLVGQLVTALKSESAPPPSVVAMTEVVFTLIKETIGINAQLMKDFQTAQGYKAIGDALLRVEDYIASSQKIMTHALGLVRDFVFVGEADVPIPAHETVEKHILMVAEGAGRRIRNLGAYQVLTTLFLASTKAEIQVQITDHILYVFAVNPLNYQTLHHLHSMVLFLNALDRFEHEVQISVLKLVEYIVTGVNYVPFEELCSMVTVLHNNVTEKVAYQICQLILKLISFDTKFRTVFQQAKLLEVILDMFRSEVVRQPQTSSTAPVTDSPREHVAFDAEGEQEQEQQQQQPAQGENSESVKLKSGDSSEVVAFDVEATSALFPVPSLAGSPYFCQVVLPELANVLLSMLEHCPENLRAFRDAGGVPAICDLLGMEHSRSAAIRVMQRLVVIDSGENEHDISCLVEVLQTAPRTALSLKTDILNGIRKMFSTRPSTKDTFRECGAFAACLVVVMGLEWAFQKNPENSPPESCQKQQDSAEEDGNGNKKEDAEELAMLTLEAVFKTLTWALSGKPENQDFFVKKVGFGAVVDAFKLSNCLSTPRAKKILQLILDMATERPVRESEPYYEHQGFLIPALCSLENPRALLLLINLLPMVTQDIQLSILRTLRHLANNGPRNQRDMSASGVIESLLSYFPLSADHPAHSDLLTLIAAVAKYGLSPAELRSILLPFASPEGPPDLLETVTNIVKESDRTPFVEIDLQGQIHIPSLDDHAWPPSNGYTFSCWFRFDEKDLSLSPQYPTNSPPLGGLTSSLESSAFSLSSVATAPPVSSSTQTAQSSGGKFGTLGRLGNAVASRVFDTFLGSGEDPGITPRGRSVSNSTLFPPPPTSGSGLGAPFVLLRLVSIDNKSFLQVSVRPGDCLEIQTSLKQTGVEFSRPKFDPGRWYHLAIVHQKKTFGASSASLFVDGRYYGSEKVPFITAPSSAGSQISGHLGAQVSYHRSSHASLPQFAWRIGPSLLVDEALTPEQITAVFIAGSSYTGHFQGPSWLPILEPLIETIHPGFVKFMSTPPPVEGFMPTGLQTQLSALVASQSQGNAMISQNLATSQPVFSEEDDVAFRAQSFDLNESSIVFAFSGHCFSVLASDQSTSPSQSATASTCLLNLPRTDSKTHGRLEGSAFVACPSSLADDLSNVDGILMLSALIERAETSVELHRSLSLLTHTLLKSVRMLYEMETLKGYLAMGHILRSKSHLITRDIHELFWTLTLCGSNQGREIIANLRSFRRLLMDWEIWRGVSIDLQKDLFRKVKEMITRSSFSRWNGARLKKVRFISLICHVLDERPPIDLAEEICSTTRTILLQRLHQDDLLTLASFILTTLDTVGSRPSKKGGNKSGASTSASASDDNSKKAQKVILSPRGKPRGTLFGGPLPTSGQTPQQTAAITVAIRNLMLRLFLEMITTAPEADTNLDLFVKAIDIKWFFHLIDSVVHPVTVFLALKILTTLMSRPQFVVKFKACDGFQLLKANLTGMYNQEEIYTVLFMLALGRPIHPFDSPSLTYLFSDAEKQEVNVVFPEALSVMLHLLKHACQDTKRTYHALSAFKFFASLPELYSRRLSANPATTSSVTTVKPRSPRALWTLLTNAVWAVCLMSSLRKQTIRFVESRPNQNAADDSILNPGDEIDVRRVEEILADTQFDEGLGTSSDSTMQQPPPSTQDDFVVFEKKEVLSMMAKSFRHGSPTTVRLSPFLKPLTTMEREVQDSFNLKVAAALHSLCGRSTAFMSTVKKDLIEDIVEVLFSAPYGGAAPPKPAQPANSSLDDPSKILEPCTPDRASTESDFIQEMSTPDLSTPVPSKFTSGTLPRGLASDFKKRTPFPFLKGGSSVAKIDPSKIVSPGAVMGMSGHSDDEGGSDSDEMTSDMAEEDAGSLSSSVTSTGGGFAKAMANMNRPTTPKDNFSPSPSIRRTSSMESPPPLPPIPSTPSLATFVSPVSKEILDLLQSLILHTFSTANSKPLSTLEEIMEAAPPGFSSHVVLSFQSKIISNLVKLFNSDAGVASLRSATKQMSGSVGRLCALIVDRRSAGACLLPDVDLLSFLAFFVSTLDSLDAGSRGSKARAVMNAATGGGGGGASGLPSGALSSDIGAVIFRSLGRMLLMLMSDSTSFASRDMREAFVVALSALLIPQNKDEEVFSCLWHLLLKLLKGSNANGEREESIKLAKIVVASKHPHLTSIFIHKGVGPKADVCDLLYGGLELIVDGRDSGPFFKWMEMASEHIAAFVEEPCERAWRMSQSAEGKTRASLAKQIESRARQKAARRLTREQEIKDAVGNFYRQLDSHLYRVQSEENDRLRKHQLNDSLRYEHALATWRPMTNALTRERAVWGPSGSTLSSLLPSRPKEFWTLDPSEGPLRMRKRVERFTDIAHIMIAAEAQAAERARLAEEERRRIAYYAAQGAAAAAASGSTTEQPSPSNENQDPSAALFPTSPSAAVAVPRPVPLSPKRARASASNTAYDDDDDEEEEEDNETQESTEPASSSSTTGGGNSNEPPQTPALVRQASAPPATLAKQPPSNFDRPVEDEEEEESPIMDLGSGDEEGAEAPVILEDEDEDDAAASGHKELLRLMDSGDKAVYMFNTARLDGLGAWAGIFVLAEMAMYVIDGLQINAEGKVVEITDFEQLCPAYADPFPNPLTNSAPPSSLFIRTATTTSPPGPIPPPSVFLKMGYDELREMYKRRYLLRSVGLEMFSTNLKNALLVFHITERDQVYARMLSFPLPNFFGSSSVVSLRRENDAEGSRLKSLRKMITEQWQRREVSNFQYLMFLNTLAGRTYNDLTQYPIFPWILSDYTSEELDLENPAVYRDLSKPMGALTSKRSADFQARYESWDESVIPKFHYGSHYSSAGITLFYLIRMEPFTKMHLQLQSGKFDHADRLFHSINETWVSASAANMSDVKELIPEFFYLPDFLGNINKFDLGTKQTGVPIGDVILPPWAKGDAREFVRKHRQALESDYVSEHLHEWIDLIFGYKQRGAAAEEAQNVFYYLTYEGAVDLDEISDPVMRSATVSQISNFGQTPQQLFTKPHPKRLGPEAANPLLLVRAQPESLEPQELKGIAPDPVGEILIQGDKPMAVGKDRILLPPSFNKTVAWGFVDHNLRICALGSDQVLSVHESMHNGQITKAAITADGKILVTGGEDTVVAVWKVVKVSKDRRFDIQRRLFAHTKPITALAICVDFGIVVSGSLDGTVVIWDLNRLSYVRQLGPLPEPIVWVGVNSLTGNIVTCTRSSVCVWTVNGEPVAQEHSAVRSSAESITCAILCNGPVWCDLGMLVTGHQDGTLRFWDVSPCPSGGGTGNLQQLPRPSWDMTNCIHATCGARLRMRVAKKGHEAAVTCIEMSPDEVRLISGDAKGALLSWSREPIRVHFVADDKVECCQRCKVNFTVTQRRHHCRNCGRVLCGPCSDKRVVLPELNWHKPVRICRDCFELIEQNKKLKERR